MSISRRGFLQAGASVAAAGAIGGTLAHAASQTGRNRIAKRSLVVIELNGGNDALNTVIPFRDSLYRIARPTLAIPESQVLKLNDEVALHPAMGDMHNLFTQGKLAIVQGVGYPNPSRSHFRSMEAWHRGDVTMTSGWLGRAFEQARLPQGVGPVPMLHFGREMPLMFSAPRAASIGISTPDDFYAPETPADGMSVKGCRGEEAGHVDLSRGEQLVRSLIQHPRRPGAYPQGRLGQSLATFADLIVRDVGTRLYYVSLGGFDTHARQAEGHAQLLAALSSSVAAFMNDLESENRAGDVLLMAFSEFGRRLKENGSAGTDHGTAGAAFFAGTAVRGGLYGRSPSLSDLDDADLRHTTNLSDCWASVLENWLGISAGRILPQSQRSLELV